MGAYILSKNNTKTYMPLGTSTVFNYIIQSHHLFMVQTLITSGGHWTIIYIIGMYMGKWCSDEQTQKIIHETNDNVFIDSVVNRCSAYNNCSKLCVTTMVRARLYQLSDWRTLPRIPGMSRSRACCSYVCSNEIHLESHKRSTPIDVPLKLAFR